MFHCDKGCCNIVITEYKKVIYDSNDGWKETIMKIKKSGCFIYNSKTDKILLVQSRAKLWGSPKGTVQFEESLLNCAIREVYEETGINVEENMFSGAIVVNSKSLYYILDIKEETELSIQADVKDNDVNGIMWIKLDCLKQMIYNGKVEVNSNTKFLIKKIYGIDLTTRYKRFLFNNSYFFLKDK
jgi:8-oxo-dGTP pyrophosphatase MutT (NUDIX family)